MLVVVSSQRREELSGVSQGAPGGRLLYARFDAHEDTSWGKVTHSSGLISVHIHRMIGYPHRQHEEMDCYRKQLCSDTVADCECRWQNSEGGQDDNVLGFSPYTDLEQPGRPG